ncbi:thioester reductase domain-containing protein [Candidatus Thiothrix sp. Deng01]|uniref:Thioester reductase domain-containing protein n=1 Tax=Candidatus Thiothrix phosphatis TaxID=3112415 RepID=A0ABU6CWN2_9GAMM|nr:thioester reductase domain-containing protein [Candidatus Thiothrix sp. Deng01]MEB4591250.1 thioester reductase domain-containing protein [Candidatus Thiothrix sp. Deng01]
MTSQANTLQAMQADAALDPAIRFDAPLVECPTAPSAILLTGATGFLGGYLLAELLDTTQATVHCLVRAADAAAAAQRLQEHLQFYGLWKPEWRERIVAVCGDLAQPRLGLGAAAFASLGAAVEAIYHNGAAVNIVTPYAQARAANVQGTQEVLRLAGLERTKPLHYVSTMGIVFNQPTERVLETDAVDPALQRNGYTQSKWVAEQLVHQAIARGLPASIYRPVRVMGHSRDGVIGNFDDFLYLIFEGVVKMNQYPAVEGEINFVPVDYACPALVALSQQADSFGKTFHLTNPQAESWVSLFEKIASLGYPLAQVSVADWFEEVGKRAKQEPDNSLYKYLKMIERMPNNIFSKKPAFDDANARAGLQGTGLSAPPVDMNLVGAYFRHFQQAGLVPRPDRSQFVAFTNRLLAESRTFKEKQPFTWQEMEFVAYPTVFSPTLFKDTFFYIRQIPIRAGETFLEMCCGAGLLSVIAAMKGASRVVAADINPHAIDNTLENARLHGVADKVQAYAGDMFAALPDEEQFDLVFANLPYVAVIDKASEDDRSLEILAMHDPGYGAIETYFRDGGRYVKPGGRLLIGFSSSVGDVGILHRFADQYGWSLQLLTNKRFPNANNYSLEIYQLLKRAALVADAGDGA